MELQREGRGGLFQTFMGPGVFFMLLDINKRNLKTFRRIKMIFNHSTPGHQNFSFFLAKIGANGSEKVTHYYRSSLISYLGITE